MFQIHRLLLAAVALGVSLSTAAAADREQDKFIAHEWGTFSTFSGSDGRALKFTPNDTDLPSFIHSKRHEVKGGVADALVSLETPVLYFYTGSDRTVSVHVDFPKGVMTDWYPAASRPPTQQLRWDDLKVLAKDKPSLNFSRDGQRYYAARVEEAATVQAAAQDNRKHEVEKFLFYRGVGDFEMPFQVKALGNGKFTVKNTGKQAIPGHFLVNIQDRKLKFKSLGKLAADAEETVELPAEATTEAKLAEAMVKALTEQGLYEAEAKAMVKAWQAAWFGENGTRVLYLVAESVTDQLLPIKIEPKPEKLVRVLVGRADVLTPERELEIDALVKRINGNSNADAQAADNTLSQQLGRYRSGAQAAAEMRIKAAGTARR